MWRMHLDSRTRLAAAGCRCPAAHPEHADERRVRPMMAGALALATGLAAMSTVRSPGDALKADLLAAGAAIRALGVNQSPARVQKTVAALFPDNAVDVDATQFPVRVAVTLRALDRITCVTAATSVRRIEGDVVIELHGFASPSECGEHNDMAWLILP